MFVWSFAAAYYILKQVAPKPSSFLDVLRSRNAEYPLVSDEALHNLDGFAFAEPV